jgi:hypothetical protein
MAVKRRIYKELEEIMEDTASPEARTAPPASLVPKVDRTLEATGQTDVPSKQSDYGEDETDTELGYTSSSRQPVKGRTWPDVFFAFSKKPQLIPMVIVFGSFLISISKFQKIGDIWRPMTIAAILIAIWFGWEAISSSRKTRKN